MLGDARTVSDQDDERESRSFDAPGGWTMPSSPAGLDLPIAPSWDDGWAAPAAATVEPNGWDASEPIRGGAAAPEPKGLTGWGGLSSTDSSPVSHDLNAWDSPSDAVVAEAPDSPWGLDPAAEAPVWGAESATTPSVSPWPSLSNPPSSAASAWAPGTLPPPVDEVPEPAVDSSEDHATPTGPLRSVTSSWSAPEAQPPAIGSLPTNAVPTAATPTADSAGDDAVSADEVVGLAYSGVPFHELAAAFAASDRAPDAEPVPAVTPATPIAAEAADPSTDMGSPAPKRRGRLAGRSPQRNAPTTDVLSDPVVHVSPSAETVVIAADNLALPGPVPTDDEVAPPAAFVAGDVEAEALPVFEAETDDEAEAETDDVAEAAAVFEAETETDDVAEALPVFEAETEAETDDAAEAAAVFEAETGAETDDAAEAAASRGFFAKRDPRETASSPRESPKALRIAAIVSLLVGVGLFGYSVVTSRSSDTKTTVATTTPTPVAPNADAPTTAPATALAGVAEVVPELAADPIFASDQAASSVPARAGAADPIFGSDQSLSSLSPSSDLAAPADPLFGPAPTVPSPDGGATAKDELTFDQPGSVAR